MDGCGGKTTRTVDGALCLRKSENHQQRSSSILVSDLFSFVRSKIASRPRRCESSTRMPHPSTHSTTASYVLPTDRPGTHPSSQRPNLILLFVASTTMKLSSAFLLVAPVAAFAPGASVNRPASSLKMSTTETKVRQTLKTDGPMRTRRPSSPLPHPVP